MKVDLVELEKRLRDDEALAIRDYTDGRGDAPVIYKTGGFALPKAPATALEAQGPQIFVASEESEDRMGDVIHIDGWKLSQFKKNPVFMFQHNYNVPPIGTVPKLWTDGKQLLNTVRWDDESPLGAEIHGKYDRRIMRAESVGFRALNVEERSSKGLAGSFNFLEQELLEISAVSIPAHPAALRKALDALGNPRQVYILGDMPTEHSTKGAIYTMTLADTITLEEEAVAEVVVEEAADEEAEADNGGDENAQESEEESTEAPETIATGAAPEAIARTFSAQDMDALRTAKDILETIIGDSKDAQSEKKEGLEVGFSGVLTDKQLRQVKEALSGVYNS
jgi:hypothetical protein